MSSKSTAMRYVGDGGFIIGVPARDLTAAEARQYRKLIADSPLYEPIEDATETTGDAPTENEPASADKSDEAGAGAQAKAGKAGKEGA